MVGPVHGSSTIPGETSVGVAVGISVAVSVAVSVGDAVSVGVGVSVGVIVGDGSPTSTAPIEALVVPIALVTRKLTT
jgi:hypothetical protein